MSRAPFIPYARVMIEAEESGGLSHQLRQSSLQSDPQYDTFMHESQDGCGKDNHKPSDDKVIALMTIVVIAVTRGRLERKQRRMCAHS